MKAVLDNQTKFPTKKVRDGVAWVLGHIEADHESLLVRVKKTYLFRHHGRFYSFAATDFPRVWRDKGSIEELELSPEVEHLIVAHIPQYPIGRHDQGLKGGPPSMYPADWYESLICITAHEAKHFRQFLYGGKTSEVESEWAEYRLLEQFRKEGGPS